MEAMVNTTLSAFLSQDYKKQHQTHSQRKYTPTGSRFPQPDPHTFIILWFVLNLFSDKRILWLLFITHNHYYIRISMHLQQSHYFSFPKWHFAL
jgi:hypothetical protein